MTAITVTASADVSYDPPTMLVCLYDMGRMCEAVGLEVARLRRTAVGSVKLGMLAPGQFRQLDKQEVRALRTMAQKGKATAQIEKNTRRRAAGTARGPRAPKGAEKRGNRP